MTTLLLLMTQVGPSNPAISTPGRRPSSPLSRWRIVAWALASLTVLISLNAPGREDTAALTRSVGSLAGCSGAKHGAALVHCLSRPPLTLDSRGLGQVCRVCSLQSLCRKAAVSMQ